MKFFIREIVLWPRRPGLTPRRVLLDPEKVNVISGASKTGKSAIIPIIDYCMGSERCAVPVETIRDACSWFGIVAETAEGQKLLARREPGQQRSTGDMYISEGRSVEVPHAIPGKNATADAVKVRLDELAGLTRLDFGDVDGVAGFARRPSLRDLVAFTFQPQNVVANPDVLFFKADTYEHREKLRTVFPYVLGAITPEGLAAQHELRWVRRQRAQKERELVALREVSERWVAELRASVVNARELGLLRDSVPKGATREALLALLESVVDRKSETRTIQEGIGDAVAELLELEEEEAKVDADLVKLRRRLAEMTRLQKNAGRFRDALKIQQERLAIARWVESLEQDTKRCPLCDAEPAEAGGLRELLKALEQVESDVGRTESVSTIFDRELLRVREDIGVAVEKLQGIAVRKDEIAIRTEEGRRARYRQSEIDRFVGRVERALEVYRALGEDGVLAIEVQELREREDGLRRLMEGEGIERRRRQALDKVASFASRLLPGLDAERPDEPIELSLTDLTVKVKGRDREDYLWEIGSGANWLAYHVAVSLALQQYFLGSRANPVPSFVVYDQPSQVYFPRRLAGARTMAEEQEEPVLADEDVEAVRKVFTTIGDVVRQSGGRLQALVLDHAGPGCLGEHFRCELGGGMADGTEACAWRVVGVRGGG